MTNNSNNTKRFRLHLLELWKENRKRPTFWAVTYFIQIIAFAFVYVFVSDEFYHSTALNEPSLRRDEREIELILERTIYEKIIGSDDFEVAQIYVSIERENRYRTQLTLSGVLGFTIANGSMMLVQRASDMGNFYIDIDFLNFNNTDNVEYDDDGNVINEFGTKVPTLVGSWGTFELEPTEPLLTLYRGWISAHNGQPSRKNGIYIRSFYLSVVTTTTLGYGDIVPLTSKTRLLVALQTIIGVVITAVFLNFLLDRRT